MEILEKIGELILSPLMGFVAALSWPDRVFKNAPAMSLLCYIIFPIWMIGAPVAFVVGWFFTIYIVLTQ